MSAVLALLSSVVWGSSDFLAGLISRRFSALVVIAWSQTIGLLALTPVLLWRGPTGVGAGWLPWAASAGVTGAVGLWAFYAALASGTMGVVAPIAATGAGVPVVLGVLTGDQPSGWAWFGMVLAGAGVVAASGPELGGGAKGRAVALAAVAAVAFGLTLFAIDRGSRVSVLHTLWGMRATSVSAYAVLALVTRSLGGVTRKVVPALALVGVADLVANGLFAVASSTGLVSIASVLGSLYPVVTTVLAWLVLHERLARIQYLGVVVTLVGTVVIASVGHS
ncbi:MAG: DMT family transporter [Actinomycetales bacterium]|nr:DMT family transporter [Actinomycetales bacterium]